MGHTTEARVMQSFSIFLLVAAFVQPVMSTNCTALEYLKSDCSGQADCIKMAQSADKCFKMLESIPDTDDAICSIKNKTEALKAMSVDCKPHIPTAELEALAKNITFDDIVLLEATLENIELPPGATLPSGVTLPSFTAPNADGAVDEVDGAVDEASNAANNAADTVGDLAAAGITPVGYLPALLVAFLVAIQMMA